MASNQQSNANTSTGSAALAFTTPTVPVSMPMSVISQQPRYLLNRSNMGFGKLKFICFLNLVHFSQILQHWHEQWTKQEQREQSTKRAKKVFCQCPICAKIQRSRQPVQSWQPKCLREYGRQFKHLQQFKSHKQNLYKSARKRRSICK